MRVRVRRVVLVLVGFVVVAALGMAVFVAAGWYNVSALKPHLPPVAWLLHTAMRESVQYHARSIQPPDLSDPALAARAAGDYATACAPCHGAPGTPPDRMGTGLRPDPPDLSETVPTWRREELFWITRNGIKMTGMPAWGPTHRDDEIWALVAFLLRLPEMSPEDYQQLTKSFPATETDSRGASIGAEIVHRGGSLQALTACARCHGLDGAGFMVGGVPRISGQNEVYMAAALDSFAEGSRKSGVMGPVAEALSVDERRAVAAYYAAIDEAPVPPVPEVELDVLRLGGALAAVGDPARNVPACSSCHGGPNTASAPGIPALAGQFAGYMRLQFHLWRQGERHPGALDGIMQRIALQLTDDEISAVSLYYASVRDGSEELALD